MHTTVYSISPSAESVDIELVTLEVRDSIAVITLVGNTPKDQQHVPKLPWGTPIHEHRLNPPLVRDLQRCLDAVEADSTVRGVVVVGEGRFWSNGLDLVYLDSVTPKRGEELTAELNTLMARVLCFPIPTVAAFNGWLLSYGLSMHSCKVGSWWCACVHMCSMVCWRWKSSCN